LLAILVLAGVFALYQMSLRLDDNGKADGFWSAVSGLFGSKLRIGLVAGHWQNDSGAVCADGLQEVDVNLDVAERTAGLLRRAGYQVDLLAEFDPRLEGYQADVFLSIHADSCVYGVSGFKLARLPDSQVGAETDRLVDALYREYAQVTGLEPHYDTITYDMREYHAFREISPETPGAIIEIGFLGEDRAVLTRRPDLVARGIARGVIAYLQETLEAEGD
jgi:N-acetylmuramoyl-L-alanine amidase